ncbi:hypothetical protein MKW92_009261 [Papaver armeniacum]|nr:hypothetical protein MKW92_009261 [Papaver armeniacum]
MEYSNVNLIVYLILILFILINETQFVYGERVNILKREKEDLELEKQLKILNKKPIKTIVTNFGDIVDCIDIYKQPAFDHPLLKDHKIQMAPSSILEATTNKNISSSVFRSSNMGHGFRYKRCPPGTVPIRRTKKQDLINARNLLHKTTPIRPYAYTLSPMENHVVSIVEFSETKAFFGATAEISVHGLQLDNHQFSTAQVWIKNGPDEEINSIEVGWMVYPALFGDSRSRLFGYWTADNQKQTGCFNVLCPGFVQVHREVFLGALIESLSVYGKDSRILPVKVYRDPQTGNWWLITTKTIGYWPKEIFTHLTNNASTLRYGGIAGAKPQTPAPPMGNGYLPQLKDYNKTAFMAEMKYVNDKGQSVNLNPYGMQTKQDATLDCYDILFAGNIGGEWEITMAFGGPGGMCP